MNGDLLGARRAVLSDELDTARKRRDELTVVIEYLSKLVGRSDADPSELVGDGEFLGKPSTEAAVEVLTRVGRTRPLKTSALYEAVTKGGVKVATPDALYRSLFRNTKFTKVGKSLWGLTAWREDLTEALPEPAEP